MKKRGLITASLNLKTLLLVGGTIPKASNEILMRGARFCPSFDFWQDQ
jgi:hypothetical protein